MTYDAIASYFRMSESKAKQQKTKQKATDMK